MAKKAKMSSTTKTTETTTSGSSKKPTITTTKTTTTSSTNVPTTRAKREPAPKKRNNWGILSAILIILIILVIVAYFLAYPQLNLTQQQGQLQNQLGRMQNNNQNLTLFYLTNAQNYNLNVNKSWSVQITDQDSNGSIVGQLTISWNGQGKNLSIQNGIVNTGISPTYAVTLSHSQFMSLSQDVITRNTAAAFAYYTAYYLTGKLKYTKVS